MATQKACTEALKAWQAATDFKTGKDAAAKSAGEFDGLYEESAKNLLARTPDLMLLLTAFQAGVEHGRAIEAAKHKPVQEGLI